MSQAAAHLQRESGHPPFTRAVGIALAFILVYQYWKSVYSSSELQPRAKDVMWIALSPAGLVLFSIYCWHRTGYLLAWGMAERSGWGRFLDWPWGAVPRAYRLIADPAQLARVPYLPSVFLDGGSLVLFVLLALGLKRLRHTGYSSMRFSAAATRTGRTTPSNYLHKQLDAAAENRVARKPFCMLGCSTCLL
jgi:hypothetical protein